MHFYVSLCITSTKTQINMGKKLNVLMVLAIAAAFMFVSCEKEPELPTVTTAEVTNVVQASATCGGEVTFDGYAETTRGVCWSPAEQPDLSGPHTTDGTGKGVFVSQITGLAPGVKYFVRAYATNSVGTVYGVQREFTTPL